MKDTRVFTSVYGLCFSLLSNIFLELSNKSQVDKTRIKDEKLKITMKRWSFDFSYLNYILSTYPRLKYSILVPHPSELPFIYIIKMSSKGKEIKYYGTLKK